MATTVTNTTFLLISALLIACVLRYLKHGEKGAQEWMKNLFQFLSGSRLTLSVLVVGAAVGIVSHILVGYLGAGDLLQDFVGAKEFLAGRSMNPPKAAGERIEYWLGQQNLESTPLARWAPLHAIQTASIDNTKKVLILQPHPPFHILLIAPIVAVCGSYQAFFLATTGFTILAYAGVFAILWRSVNLSQIVPGAALGLLLAMDWQPFLANIRQGQIHAWIAFLLVAGWYCMERGRPSFGGALIGLAAALKMFPALLLVWLWFRKKRAFFGALAAIFLLVAALYVLRGSGAFADYFQTVRLLADHFGRGRQNYSLSSVIGYFLAGSFAKTLAASAAGILSEAILLGCSLWQILRNPKPDGEERALEFGCWVVLSCLLSPTMEAFYYLLLLFPLAAVAAGIQPRRALGGAICLLAILWCFSSPEQVVWRPTLFFTPLLGERLSFLLFSFPTFGMLTLWGWMALRLRAKQQAAASQSVAPASLAA